MSVHSISSWQAANKRFIYPIWIWDAVNGGLQPQLWSYNIMQARPYPISSKNHPHTCTCNMARRMHPYDRPQHLKVLKHFVYIHYGCGMQSMGVCCFNHDTTTSYRLSHIPFSLKFTPTPAHVIRHKGVPICPSTASQGAKSLCIHPILMWDAVNGGLLL